MSSWLRLKAEIAFIVSHLWKCFRGRVLHDAIIREFVYGLDSRSSRTNSFVSYWNLHKLKDVVFIYIHTYIHILTPVSYYGRQRQQSVIMCFDPGKPHPQNSSMSSCTLYDFGRTWARHYLVYIRTSRLSRSNIAIHTWLSIYLIIIIMSI